jgi:hypothetical protein
LPAEVTATSTHYGHPTCCRLSPASTSVAQLPVLFYPDLLEVRDNGRKREYGNLGRFVALELTEGEHVIEIRFVGVRWANRLSASAVVLVFVLLAASVLRSLRRRLSPGPDAPPRDSAPAPAWGRQFLRSRSRLSRAGSRSLPR